MTDEEHDMIIKLSRKIAAQNVAEFNAMQAGLSKPKAGKKPLPPSYGGCDCPCHNTYGIIHLSRCCSPPNKQA